MEPKWAIIFGVWEKFGPKPGLLIWMHIASLLPFWIRFMQNMKKWLVYGHKLQAWNSLKFVLAISGPITLIIFITTHDHNVLWVYYGLKTVSTAMKIFWDIYIDWGLFRGTKPHNRFLRDNMKFSPAFYYCAMVFDFIG